MDYTDSWFPDLYEEEYPALHLLQTHSPPPPNIDYADSWFPDLYEEEYPALHLLQNHSPPPPEETYIPVPVSTAFDSNLVKSTRDFKDSMYAQMKPLNLLYAQEDLHLLESGTPTYEVFSEESIERQLGYSFTRGRPREVPRKTDWVSSIVQAPPIPHCYGYGCWGSYAGAVHWGRPGVAACEYDLMRDYNTEIGDWVPKSGDWFRGTEVSDEDSIGSSYLSEETGSLISVPAMVCRVEGEIRQVGRDDWDCDFCGMECFCLHLAD
jgi:hypothetical protein